MNARTETQEIGAWPLQGTNALLAAAQTTGSLSSESSRSRSPVAQEPYVISGLASFGTTFFVKISSTERKTPSADVRKYYTFGSAANDRSVTTFLTEHPEIPEILIEAIPQLQKYFGLDSIFELRVLGDPDAGRHLYAVVIWRGPVVDARTALNKFDDEWWISRVDRSGGYLTFTYELA